MKDGNGNNVVQEISCYYSSLHKNIHSKAIRSYGHSAEEVSCFIGGQLEDTVMNHLKTDDKTISATYIMSTHPLPDP